MALTKIPSSLLDTSGGFDLQGNITLGDNEQIQLGDSGDLAIYHDGSHSYIDDSGTGGLILKAGGTMQLNTPDDERMIRMVANDAVTLYYNNGNRIETTSAGATVTGTLTVTGDLDITGDINSYNVTDLDVTDKTITLGAGQTEANSGDSGIIIDGSNASLLWNETGNRFDLSNDLKIGAEDGGQFSLEISGGSTGTAEGGELRLNTAADYDGTYNHYRLDVWEDDFRIGRAGTTDLNIDSAGRVQIGTTTASGLLNVDGNLHYGGQLRVNDPSHDGTESNPSICVGYDNDNGFFRPTSNTIAMTTAGTERMRITATGNVGIGTDSPGHKLDVEGGNNVFDIARFGSSASDNSEVTIGYFDANATNGIPGLIEASDFGGLIQGGENGHLVLGIRDNDTSDALDIVSGGGNFMSDSTYDTLVATFKATGNVGIGTNNPQMGLHVGSGSQSTSALPGIGIANGGSSYSFYSASDGTKQYIAGVDHTISYTKSGTLSNHSHAIVSNNAIRLFCKNDGFLGIGDVDPDSTVHIKNSTTGGPQIHMDDGTNSAFINFDGTNLQLSTQRDMVDGTWHNTAKSWGGINIKGKTDGSEITMQTAPNANTSPTVRFLISKNGSTILNSTAATAGHSFEVQDQSDGYSMFWTGRSSSAEGRGLTASYGLMGVNSTQYDNDGAAYPIAGIGAAADNASHESVDFWFGSTQSEWQPMVFFCIGAHTNTAQTGQTAGWALIRATHYNNGISSSILDSGGGGTWTISVQGTFGADRANTSRVRITYSSNQNRTVLSVWGANYSGFYGAQRA